MFEIINEHFFLKILLLFLISRFFGEVFERFKKPSMIGEIVAGILIGPSLLNWVDIDSKLNVLNDISVFFLVILAGLEINISDIKDSMKGKNIWISIVGFCLPFVSGFYLGKFFNFSFESRIFLGLCISITALPVSIRMLMDLNKLNTVIGKKIISCAVFNDIVALMILGIILNIHQNKSPLQITDFAIIVSITLIKVILFFTLIYLSSKALVYIKARFPQIEELTEKYAAFFKSKESIFSFMLGSILIFSALSEIAGLHMVVGTFFGAMLLKRSYFNESSQIRFEKNISGISMGFLAPIFFTSIGLEMHIQTVTNYVLLIAVLFISFFTKIFGGYLGAKIAGLSNKNALTIGIGLNGRGLMELVIANIAYNNGLIDNSLYSILIIMGVITTLSTSYLLKVAFDLVDKAALLAKE